MEALHQLENGRIALYHTCRELLLGNLPKWSLISLLRQLALEIAEMPSGQELRDLLEAETALSDAEEAESVKETRVARQTGLEYVLGVEEAAAFLEMIEKPPSPNSKLLELLKRKEP